MRKKYLLWVAGLSMFYSACKTSEQPTAIESSPEPALFTVQNEPTSLQEFLYVYNKNNFARDSLKPGEDMRQYLELYINFKLKVQEAKEAQMHQQQAFLEELAGYKKQLAKPYLSEKEVSEQLVQQAYQRLGTEVMASHILIGLKQNPEPADTLAAYNKIMDLRQKLQEGEDFETLARRYSEDPSASMNGGKLGYFTALQMVYPFENAAYNTAEGEISQAVRTNFGYHLLKIHDKRPSQGKVKVAHMMVRTSEEPSAEELQAAEEKINELYKRLKAGANWDQLVSQFSEDRSTKSKGGALEWFGTGSMVPSFEEAAFSLKQKGEFSAPVRTPYGWHIIRLIEKQGLPPLEEMREELEAKVSRDSRAQLQEAALLSRLSKENRLQEQHENIQDLLQKADSSLLKGRWQYAPDSLERIQPLFSLNDTSYTVGQFANWLQGHVKPVHSIGPKQYLKNLYKDWQKESLLAYEEAHLEEKYDEYRMLVQEYHDGILLFQLMDEKVWTKALEDTIGLEQFFLANNDKYQWQERIAGTLFSAANVKVLEQVEQALSNSPFLWAELSLPASAPGQQALSGNTARALDKLMVMLRQDESASLRIRIPETDKALQQQVQSHLQAMSLSPERYQIEEVKEGVAVASIFSPSPKALERSFNQKAPLSLQVIEGPFERGDHEVVDAAKWEQGNQLLQQDGRAYLLRVEEVLPPAQKKLDEVRGQVISDYQEYLEKQWITSLRQKYSIQVNEKLLEQTLENIEAQL